MAMISRTVSRLLAASPIWRREDGQGMAEYAMILLFVAVACVAAFTLFGNAVNTTVSSVVSSF
jgi:Flp pilus assembly pilin Flp